MKIRIAGIVKESVVDGPGVRYVVFTQGCFHNCPGCHNPETHDINGGKEMDVEDIIKDLKGNKLLDGVTFSGGEPFLHSRQLSYIASEIKSMGLNIVAYTGYKYEELTSSDDKNIKELLNLTDILIDGRFRLDQKDISLKFRGSRNQRVLDVKKSISEDRPVLFCD